MRLDIDLVSPLAERGVGCEEVSSQIAGMLPRHTHYVQLQSGGLEVLLRKAPSRVETVNDSSHGIVTFWKVLRDRPGELSRACSLTPVSRLEFDAARRSGCHSGGDDLEVARRVWVLLSQSQDGPARLRPEWRGVRRRPRGVEDTAVEQMEALARRLKTLALECRPPTRVVKDLGGQRSVCFYADLRDNPFGAQGADPGAGFRTDHAALLDALAAANAAAVVRLDAAGTDAALPPRWSQTTLTDHAGSPVVVWSNRLLSVQQPLFDVAAGTDRL